MQQEILDGLKYLESDTIFARHFAYPCGSNSPESDTLVKNHFTSVRKIAWTENSNRVDTLNSFFYSVPCNQPIIRGMGIDQGYNISLEQICRSLDRSRRDELALLLFCHKIDDSQGVYVLSPELFKSVVEYCHNNDIPFLTLSQMYAHE